MFKLTYGFVFAYDDHNAHLTNFLEFCDTFKSNGCRMMPSNFDFLIHFEDKANSWLTSYHLRRSHPLKQKFLSKFFPPAKTGKMRNNITFLLQMDGESLHKVWDRCKDLCKSPQHGLRKWLIFQTFHNGLIVLLLEPP